MINSLHFFTNTNAAPFSWLLDTSTLWSDEHHELPPFHLGFLDDHTIVPQGIGNSVQRFQSQGLGIDNLAAAKAHGHLDLVLFFQKFSDLSNLEVEIMLFGFGPELDLPCFDDRLFLTRFLLFLLQLIAKLVKVHDPADRRISLIGNLDKIKTLFAGSLQGRSRADDSNLFAVGVDEPDFAIVNIFVDFDFQVLLGGRSSDASFFDVRSSG
jgi:hypothetical protein